tara:strand:+ start:244 stop:2475 length:2232 start_codon:yes stop_codon:yes gene_type:complete
MFSGLAQDLNSQLSFYSNPQSFNPSKIRELINQGAEVDTLNKWGNSPLIMAVILRNLDLIVFLKSKGANPLLKNKKGYTALDFAKKLKRKDIIAILNAQSEAAGQGASNDTNRPSFEKEVDVLLSPYLEHSGYNSEKIKELIEKGANVNAKNRFGNSVLIMAVLKKDIPLIQFLLEKGADPNQKNSRGFSALTFAKRDNNIYRHFLEGDKTSFYNKDLKKVIDHRTYDSNLIRQYIEKGADINTVNRFGNSVLMMAVIKKDIKLIKYLLRKNADKNKKNSRGFSPLDFAKRDRLLWSVFNAPLTDDEENDDGEDENEDSVGDTEDDDEEEISDTPDPVDSTPQADSAPAELTPEEKLKIRELYEPAKIWATSNSVIDMNKFKSSFSIKIDYGSFKGKKKFVEVKNAKRFLDNFFRIFLKINKEKIINKKLFFEAEVRIVNETETPVKVLLAFNSESVDPKYCPNQWEVFVPGKTMTDKTTEFILESNIKPDHLIFAVGGSCSSKEILLRNVTNVKADAKLDEKKQEACGSLREETREYEEIVEKCGSNRVIKKGQYKGTVLFPSMNEAANYARYKANHIARESCTSEGGIHIEDLNSSKKSCNNVGNRMSCEGEASIRCSAPFTNITPFYKKRGIKQLETVLSNIIKVYTDQSKKPNVTISEDFKELYLLAKNQLNQVIYIKSMVNDGNNKRISCVAIESLKDFTKESSKTYSCMKDFLYPGLDQNIKARIKFVNKIDYPTIR